MFLFNKWRDHVKDVTDQNRDQNVAWAAYHAKEQNDTDMEPCLSSLLSLFYEQAKSPAMIRHAMDVICKSTEHLNPGQVPIITFDLPLYALAKQIQWTWPVTYGETLDSYA